MTALTLTLPRLGETMEEATVVGWLVAPGVAFRRGQPIVELETDKTVVEYPALGDGVLDEILARSGDRIAVGAPLARATVADGGEWSEAADAVAPATGGTPGTAVLLMPRLGETMEEGTVVAWLVAPGAAYVRGEALLEIETDKTVAEVPALADGRMVAHLVEAGARVAVGTAIATIEGEGEEGAEHPGDGAGVSAAGAGEASGATEVAGPAPLAPQVGRRRATPVARRLARAAGLALEGIAGSGRRGRIEARDVMAAGAATATGPGARFMPVPGGRIAFDVFGPETGDAILLLHGFSGDRRAWAAIAAILARAGRRVIVPDLPAHGETEVEAGGIAGVEAAMAAFAAGVSGRLHIVGHSLGAVVATALAGALGDRALGLTLVTPAGCGPEIATRFVTGMAAAATAGEVAHLLRLLGPKGGSVSDPALAAMAAEAGRGRLVALAADFVGPLGQRVDILRPLGPLAERLPVRALFGTEDRVVPVAQALAMPPRVAVHFLPGGHMPQWDAPAEVAALIALG